MDSKNGQKPVVGLLYPGEMGSAVGSALARAGFPVVTTLEGRGPRTRQSCREAGLEVLETLPEVVRNATLVLCLVPPGAALDMAERFRTAARGLARPPLYVDLNSISPVTMDRMAALLAEAHLDLVDGAIQGLASQLRSRAIVFLSGARAEEVAALLGQALRVEVVGPSPGQASTLKSLLAGLSKGLTALFLEMAQLGREADMLPEMLTALRAFYPEVMEVIERLVPTYPRHAARRGQEMEELETTMRVRGLRPCVVAGTRRLIEAVGRLDLGDRNGSWTVPGVVEELHRRRLLREPPAAPEKLLG